MKAYSSQSAVTAARPHYIISVCADAYLLNNYDTCTISQGVLLPPRAMLLDVSKVKNQVSFSLQFWGRREISVLRLDKENVTSDFSFWRLPVCTLSAINTNSFLTHDSLFIIQVSVNSDGTPLNQPLFKRSLVLQWKCEENENVCFVRQGSFVFGRLRKTFFGAACMTDYFNW